MYSGTDVYFSVTQPERRAVQFGVWQSFDAGKFATGTVISLYGRGQS